MTTKTLKIDDLPVVEVLDRAAMTAVSGGQLPEEIARYIRYVDAYTHGGCSAVMNGECI
jgi:hypothetical protein